MQRYSPQSLYSISEEITPTDDRILRRGGTTSNVERLPSRLQQSKRPSKNSRQEIEDLAFEISYLKGELQWQKESKQVLLQLKEQIFEMFHKMEEVLIQATTKLQEAENRYLNLWELEGGEENEGGWI